MGLEWGFYIGKGIARSGVNLLDNPLLWAQKGMILRPPDYESGALTN